MTHRPPPALGAALALVCAACTAAPAPAPVKDEMAAPAAALAAAAHTGCLDSGDGFLRARLRGALDLDVSWRNDEIECTGGTRPDGNGLRVTIAGPLQSDGRRLRFVFGMAGVEEGAAAQQVPTNLTVIFEGERRLFATRGDDKCTIDVLQQQRTGALGGDTRSWRVQARGFCTAPAATLQGVERLLVTRFDFAGRIDIGESPPPETARP